MHFLEFIARMEERSTKLLRSELWARFKHPTVRQIVFSAAFAAFIGGIFLSIQAEPKLLQNISLPALLALLIFVPAKIFLIIIDFQLTARLLNKSIRFTSAAQTIVLASAANMLPLPGG